MSHLVKIIADGGQLRAELICNEPEGAWCRKWCAQGCEEWGPDHEHPLTDYGKCLAVEWAEADEFTALDAEVATVPVNVTWEGDGWAWGPAVPGEEQQ